MRLDNIDVFSVEVADLCFAVRMTWPEWRRLVDTAKDVPTDAEAEGAESRADAALDEWRETIRKHVIGVSGLTEDDGEGGEKAVAWSPDMTDKLSPALVQKLFVGICQPGIAKQVGDPLA